MDRKALLDEVVGILKPFVKNQEALVAAANETSIQKDLKVNSARLVDVVLEIEERFDISVSDEEADKIRTVGEVVDLILRRKGDA